MSLYLIESENIYFPQIRGYFKEIVSSYDNGNYRSAMVMLYSTIVCDLLLKLKELNEVYSDKKAEEILVEVEKKRKGAMSSEWEWTLIKKIREKTELLPDESYIMVEHIYDYRNFSAHPALNEDYELISPSQEMTVAYVKQALHNIFSKPPVFAQNIVDRLSDEIAEKKDIYKDDYEAFRTFLQKAYLRRMSNKMVTQVFKAFWKFTFIKSEGDVFADNRLMNRRTLEVMLESHRDLLCNYIRDNSSHFGLAQDDACESHLCVLLAFFPQIYPLLDATTQHQIVAFDQADIGCIKWFVCGDLEQHIMTYCCGNDLISSAILNILQKICTDQGQPNLFVAFLLKYYSESDSYNSTRNRFDRTISKYLDIFTATNFVKLIEIINSNNQIYGYGWQQERNDKIMEYAKKVLPEIDLSVYEHFQYTHEESGDDNSSETDISTDSVDADEELPF